MILDKKRIDRIIRYALKEDIWSGDVTTKSVLNRFLVLDSVILSRSDGVVSGMEVIERVFASVDVNLRFKPLVSDGDIVSPDQEIAFIEGEAHSILKAERTALNFLGLMSGVSTRTRKMVEAVEGTDVKIFDTRKTIPLHRYMQKYAVRIGGGQNHRSGLYDMVLIKDNHLRALGIQLKTNDSGKIISDAVNNARQNVQKNIRVEIEVENLKECGQALDVNPDVIMLDNMGPDLIREAVLLRKEKELDQKVLFEVSGGITIENIRVYAETGVDIISSGSLTGSVQQLDFSLEVIL